MHTYHCPWPECFRILTYILTVDHNTFPHFFLLFHSLKGALQGLYFKIQKGEGEREYNFCGSLLRSNEALVKYTDSSWVCLFWTICFNSISI